MIAPRRAGATDDLDLVPGVLGLVAIAADVRLLVAELAADDGDVTVDADIVDAVLGLAALADAVARYVPRDRAPVVVAEPRAPAASGELLR